MQPYSNIYLSQTSLNKYETSSEQFIYKIELAFIPKGHTSIKVSFLENGRLIASATDSIQEWPHTSSLYAASLGQIYRISSSVKTENIQASIETHLTRIGTLLWKTIHFNDKLQEPWVKFQKAIENSNHITKFIMISGDSAFLSTPFESLKFSEPTGTFLRKHSVPIYRSFTNDVDEMIQFNEVQFPKKVIVLLGKDSGEKGTLDYKGEVREWYNLLYPNREINEDELVRCVTCGNNLEKDDVTITIIPKGNIKDLEGTIEDQKEAFIFMYIGHGGYSDYANEKDGDLLFEIPHDSIQENNSHDTLISVLKKSPVVAIFLNCCEGFRNYDDPYLGEDSLSNAEVNYFNQLYDLKLIIGFRSKVTDRNARNISIKLIETIINNLSAYNFIKELNERAIEAEHNPNLSYSHLQGRDQSSMVMIVR